jgi:hypothetical protein
VSLLLDGIQEELRREDLVHKFKKSLPWIFAGIAIILVFTAGYSIKKNMHENNLIQAELMYAEALENIENKN